MNEYINLSLENIEEEHICCAIGDPKHQEGVDCKKEWIKNKLKDYFNLLSSSSTEHVKRHFGKPLHPMNSP